MSERLESSDLCFFDELAVGEYFYLPFQGVLLMKEDYDYFCMADEGPSIPTLPGLWLVARYDEMACRRCGCTERTACNDARMDGRCGWAAPGLCTACLTAEEFEGWLATLEERAA